MVKNIVSIICGVTLALMLSFFANSNALMNLRFHLGLYDIPAEEKQVEDTLKLFNRNFATLFNTGGDLSVALNEFPAANMIKRRVVQEINDWAGNNKVLVYDKDVFEIETIILLSPGRALAVTREVWFLNVQNRENRREKSGVKASPIRVRYFLKKIDSKWRVIEYEVFGKDDDIPVMNTDRIWL